jgi:hypothetical protein
MALFLIEPTLGALPVETCTKPLPAIDFMASRMVGRPTPNNLASCVSLGNGHPEVSLFSAMYEFRYSVIWSVFLICKMGLISIFKLLFIQK